MFRRIVIILVAFALLLFLFITFFPIQSFSNLFTFGFSERVLILYDESDSAYGQKNLVDPFSLRQLMGHFNVTVNMVTATEYRRGMLEEYSKVFYMGTKADQRPPSYMIDDLYNFDRGSVMWINTNLEALQQRHKLGQRGFRIDDSGSKNPTNSVLYKDRVLWKRDPDTYRVVVTDPKKVKIWAQARSAEGPIPWVVQADKFWYVASNPFSYMVEGSCYLAFCDLLHDFLEQNHETEHKALVRIEDVHVMRDPVMLKEVADYLFEQKISFGFTLIPVYKKDADSPAIYMNEKPEFLEAIRYMTSKGGIPILHGYTHQRTGETAQDYEFWSGPTGGPRLDDSKDLVRNKVSAALQECFQNQIYPLLWTTPHYAGSQLSYSVFKEFFTTVWERRQPVDVLGSDQFFPYLIKKDMHDQIIIPETLGYLTMDNSRSPEALIEDAANTLVVRDGYASLFYHSFLPLQKLEKTVQGVRELGYEFVGLTDFNNLVSSEDRVVLSRTVEVGFDLKGRFLHEYTIDPEGVKTNETFSFRPISGKIQRYITMSSGRRKVLEGVSSTPTLTVNNVGKFRPSLSGVTHPLALFLLFVGLMILLTFLVVWIFLLGKTAFRSAKRMSSGRD